MPALGDKSSIQASARTLSPTPHLIWSFGEVDMGVASIIGHVVQRGGEREMRVLSLPLLELLCLALAAAVITGGGVSCACCSPQCACTEETEWE
jgi:hypothetical protein